MSFDLFGLKENNKKRREAEKEFYEFKLSSAIGDLKSDLRDKGLSLEEANVLLTHVHMVGDAMRKLGLQQVLFDNDKGTTIFLDQHGLQLKKPHDGMV